MAGDWIKFEVSTPEKQEVLAITVAMGWDDPDLTVGKLLRVWRWFDQHTVDGNGHGVSAALLDRIAGVTGFASAMEKVGWLSVTDDGIELSNFGRHNGETAKSRALTAKRVAKHKANAEANATGNDKGNAANVTGELPREEKRREEKKRHSLASNDAVSVGFSEFWTSYPKKASKPAAEKAYRKLNPSTELQARMLAAVALQAKTHDWTKDKGQYVPHAATWINNRRWEDQLPIGVESSMDRFAGAK